MSTSISMSISMLGLSLLHVLLFALADDDEIMTAVTRSMLGVSLSVRQKHEYTHIGES